MKYFIKYNQWWASDVPPTLKTAFIETDDIENEWHNLLPSRDMEKVRLVDVTPLPANK